MFAHNRFIILLLNDNTRNRGNVWKRYMNIAKKEMESITKM